ncbi:MAG: aminoacetone oxidase family FAD-binding enzyme [Clostridia bacterium]|nr:aminoacetone oxidase family FAD-binding enzyme [Clostridia bacterium]
MKIAVIGGGASGLAAAIKAASDGAEVTVFEKNDRVGKKLLATGNGRCNLMNAGGPRYHHGAALARTLLKRFGEKEIRAFFDECGLVIAKEPEEDGRLYPACGQAAAVLDALRWRVERAGVRMRTGGACQSVRRSKGRFLVVTDQEETAFDAVILACGSPAGGGMDSYHLASTFGHTLVTPVSALCPIECDMRPFRALKGIRAQAILSLYGNGAFLSCAGGECLFTEDGLSGICAMQLAADAQEALRRGRCEIRMDLSPLLGFCARRHFYSREPVAPHEKAALSWLQTRRERIGDAHMLRGALARPMAELIEKSGSVEQMARMLTAWPFCVTGIRSRSAQVIRGGIAADEVDEMTLESRLVPGLYLCGEMLDVDGDCGGYNLMFAWASGFAAGEAAARRKE